jgi:hypothetical protein
MKKVGIIAVWLLLIGSGYAQKTMVRVHLRYTADDTFRFFIPLHENGDSSIQRLKAVWGIPTKEDAGYIEWDKLNIPNVGDGVQVYLSDGILANDLYNITYLPFRNDKDKNQRIKTLGEYDKREIRIEFERKGKKIANSKPTENILKDYLTTIFN